MFRLANKKVLFKKKKKRIGVESSKSQFTQSTVNRIPKKEEDSLVDNTNVISVNLALLSKHTNDVRSNDKLITCEKCSVHLNNESKLLTKKEYLENKKGKKKENEEEEEKEKEKEKENEDSDLEEEEESDDDVLEEEDIPEEALIWECEFCGSPQILEDIDKEKIIPSEQSVDYLVKESNKNKENKEKTEEDEGSTVVFCIDTSGSMSVTSEIKDGKLDLSELNKHSNQSFGGFGQQQQQQTFGGLRRRHVFQQQRPQQSQWVSRLQCLQIAVGNQIEALSRESPNSKVVLVTFSNKVEIHSNGVDNALTIEGNDLDNFTTLKQIGSDYQITQSVGKVGKTLIKKVYSLQENGQTALGPAAAIASAIAGQKKGSKVILCTDGLSNIGIGALEEDEQEEQQQKSSEQLNPDEFYDELSEYCSEKGVVVDVITLEDTDCRVDQIGKLSDRSSGTVDIVKPLELTTRFKNIMSNPVVATSVLIEILLHKELYILNEDDRKVGSRLEKDVGNVTQETELSFNYGVKEDADEADRPDEVPFQVKINYTKLDGSQWLRTLTQRLKITDDEVEALNDIDYGLMNQNFMQRAGRHAKKGVVKESAKLMKQQKAWYSRVSQMEKLQSTNLTKNMEEFKQQENMWNEVIEDEDMSSEEEMENEKKDKKEKKKVQRKKHHRKDKHSKFIFSSSKYTKK
ncbi:hypothetical protein M0812_30177 [Anaeramoeba flamelloides]|uniref:Sec23/Sec24 trunk domain-containing protein n=1 Tax=Anaeramoeba flamelloides TaxID=1746091 RepID=A0AAV7Y282_9EUKA|nr:hypothetical protein M0812_30177 [Anaeramoeba flamelloides]